MFRTVEDFKRAWALETDYTLQCFRILTDESLAYKSPAFPRGLGRLAYHVAESPNAYFSMTGTSIEGPAMGATATSTTDLIGDYENTSNSLLAAVSKWSDADLLKPVSFFGQDIPQGALLHVIVTHQAHHRGQLTVLMREAGLPLPNFYGPTVETWRAMGKEPMP